MNESTRGCALSEFGYVPQSAALDATFPITVREIVEMGAYGRLRPFERLPIAEKNRVDRVLEQVGVSDLAARVRYFPPPRHFFRKSHFFSFRRQKSLR